jgi:hypothetical protein
VIVSDIHTLGPPSVIHIVHSVFTVIPKIRVFEPGRGRWYLRAIHIRSTTAFEVEVKPSVPCHKVLKHVEEPCEYERYFIGKLRPFIASLVDFGAVNCQRALVDEPRKIRTQL